MGVPLRRLSHDSRGEALVSACVAACAAEDVVRRLLAEEAATNVSVVGSASRVFRFGEETITELVVATMVRRGSGAVRLAVFTKAWEARRSGADWICAFQYPGGEVLAMLVQAKRAYPATGTGNRRAYICDKPNKKTKMGQLTTLRNMASILGINAVYAMYTMHNGHSTSCASSSSSATIHLVAASALSRGHFSFTPGAPNMPTLSELVCCLLASGRATVSDHNLLLRRYDGAIDDLVARARGLREVRGVIIATVGAEDR